MLLTISEIVKDRRRRQRDWIVVSAAGKRRQVKGDVKVTDLLIILQNLMEDSTPNDHQVKASDFQTVCKWAGGENNLSVDTLWEFIAEHHRQIASHDEINFDIEPILGKIKNEIVTKKGRAFTVSRGEYLMACIVAQVLGYEFVDAAQLVKFDVDQAGNVRLNEHETKKQIQAHCLGHKCVIPGFYGSSIENQDQILVFSRGGSDISGALIAAALSTDVYENWTDVPGVAMADPRFFGKNGRRWVKWISEISYRELREAVYAQVLHEDAVQPVRKHGIPINIRCTLRPDHPGTMVVRDRRPNERLVQIIAGRSGFVSLCIGRDESNDEIGYAATILEVLKAEGIWFHHVATSIDSISVIIPAEALSNGKLRDAIQAIRDQVEPDRLVPLDDLALICLVGDQVGVNSNKVLAYAHAGLWNAGIEGVRLVEMGSSQQNVIVGVNKSELEDAIRALHDVFASSTFSGKLLALGRARLRLMRPGTVLTRAGNKLGRLVRMAKLRRQA